MCGHQQQPGVILRYRYTGATYVCLCCIGQHAPSLKLLREQYRGASDCKK